MKTLIAILSLCGFACAAEDYRPVICTQLALASLDVTPTPPTPPTPEPSGICSNCKGKGKVGDGTVMIDCIVCGGDGRVDTADCPCGDDCKCDPCVCTRELVEYWDDIRRPLKPAAPKPQVRRTEAPRVQPPVYQQPARRYYQRPRYRIFGGGGC